MSCRRWFQGLAHLHEQEWLRQGESLSMCKPAWTKLIPREGVYDHWQKHWGTGQSSNDKGIVQWICLYAFFIGFDWSCTMMQKSYKYKKKYHQLINFYTELHTPALKHQHTTKQTFVHTHFTICIFQWIKDILLLLNMHIFFLMKIFCLHIIYLIQESGNFGSR